MSAFAALADPHRRQILDLLLSGERSAGSLVGAVPLAEIDAWLARYRPHWTSILDALERHLEANP